MYQRCAASLSDCEMRRPVLVLATIVFALGITQAASAAPAESRRVDRDHVKALRLTVDWLAAYPEPLWVGVEMPGRCQPLVDGRRACPIAISLLAWTRGELVPWRCDAQALLPAPGSTARARRSSARCHPLAEPV
jgi:hypothetical protein